MKVNSKLHVTASQMSQQINDIPLNPTDKIAIVHIEWDLMKEGIPWLVFQYAYTITSFTL